MFFELEKQHGLNFRNKIMLKILYLISLVKNIKSNILFFLEK